MGETRTSGTIKAIKNKVKKENHRTNLVRWFWQGHKDLNPEPTVLETAALPIELYPYIYIQRRRPEHLVGLQGLEPGTIRL